MPECPENKSFELQMEKDLEDWVKEHQTPMTGRSYLDSRVYAFLTILSPQLYA